MKTITKNLFRVLFLAMISMSLMINTGCNKDDDVVVDEMIGTWILHEIDVTEGVITVTISPAEFGLSITTIFTANAYTATVTVTGESPVIEIGTWTRTNSTTIVLTAPGEDPMTLTKEGVYYVHYDSNGKMKYKKQ